MQAHRHWVALHPRSYCRSRRWSGRQRLECWSLTCRWGCVSRALSSGPSLSGLDWRIFWTWRGNKETLCRRWSSANVKYVFWTSPGSCQSLSAHNKTAISYKLNSSSETALKGLNYPPSLCVTDRTSNVLMSDGCGEITQSQSVSFTSGETSRRENKSGRWFWPTQTWRQKTFVAVTLGTEGFFYLVPFNILKVDIWVYLLAEILCL